MPRVLIVDDNANNRALLVRLLGQDGHEVHEAVNGAEAIGLARTRPCDLVLTDILMPKVDGYELERHLRDEPTLAHIPVIFHTAAYTDSEVTAVVDAPALMRVITKPSDVQDIRTAVNDMLRTRHRPLRRRHDGGTRRHLETVNASLIQSRRELELADRERRRLMLDVLQAQEDERERIAADIHDDTVQVMTAVAMRLELLRGALPDPAERDRHEQLEHTVREAIGRLRQLMFHLHPPELDDQGLAAAVRAWLDHAEPPYRCEVIDRLIDEPPPAVRLLLYRIIQEALSNVAKHAKAEHAHVRLDEAADDVVVHVTDDGRGLIPDGPGRGDRGHLGLASMRRRAELAGGTWHFDSRPGQGTMIRVRVPRHALAEPSA